MILFLSDLQKEHFIILNKYSYLELVDFCKLAIDYLNNGCNTNKYGVAARKLNVSITAVQNAVHALAYLLVEGCKYNLSESDFKSSLVIAGFSAEQQEVLLKLFNNKKSVISHALHLLQQKDAIYQDLTWRFEVQVASRGRGAEVKPAVAMNFITKTQKHAGQNSDNNSDSISVNNNIQESKTASHCQNVIRHNLAQCDLPNLMHLTDKLEQALKESKSQHVRKVQRPLQ